MVKNSRRLVKDNFCVYQHFHSKPTSAEKRKCMHACRDSGNDFSFPVPFPFKKLNDNEKNSFLFGYPKNKSHFFLFLVNPKRKVFSRSKCLGICSGIRLG